MNSKAEILTVINTSYAGKNMEITLIQSQRKSFTVEVTPDLKVVAKAPINIGIEQIENRINKRRSWIYRQLCYFEEYQHKVKEIKYKPGETFLFLGKEYILKANIGNKVGVSLNENIMNVTYNERNTIKSVIDGWYREQAYATFEKLFHGVIKLFKDQEIQPKDFRVRKMHSRRGSCSRNGTITINVELVKAPIGCIKYVLAHECCHLIEFTHTKRFLELLEYIMPDRKLQKNRLEKLVA